LYVSENNVPNVSFSSPPLTEMPPSKIDKILQIIRSQPDGKIIIFSSFQETFDLIRETMRENDIHFGEIKGSMISREKVIQDFKEHDLNVLFINSMDSGAGINLQEATDLILFHPICDSMFTQIRGRAYRIGRTLPLHIHYLQ
jgi:SNF2 family DNA or RNA helicase